MLFRCMLECSKRIMGVRHHKKKLGSSQPSRRSEREMTENWFFSKIEKKPKCEIFFWTGVFTSKLVYNIYGVICHQKIRFGKKNWPKSAPSHFSGGYVHMSSPFKTWRKNLEKFLIFWKKLQVFHLSCITKFYLFITFVGSFDINLTYSRVI